jgi:hypothetical protein
MSMIDHLFLLPDAAAAHTYFEPLGLAFPADDESPARFANNVLLCQVIVGHAADGTDVYMAGQHVNVACDGARADFIGLPECVLVTDRDRGSVEGAVRADFLIHTKVSEATMDAVLGITPVFAGSNYPLGVTPAP